MTPFELLDKMRWHLTQIQALAQQAVAAGYAVTAGSYTRNGTPILIFHGGKKPENQIAIKKTA